MIIAIIIVVILVSSLGIYFYPHNDTHYYNNGDSIHFLYAGTDVIYDYREYNCSVSSYSVGNGNPSYLNSTALIERSYSSCTLGQISFNMNIKTQNINSGDIRVSISANHFCADLTYKNKEYFNDYPKGVSILISNTGNVNISGVIFGFHLNGTRTVITVSSGKLTNTYYITTQVQSALYGQVDYTGTGNIDRVNGEFIIQNDNNSHMNIVNIYSGYYYYFVHPDTAYTLYSINNGTLKEIGTIGNKTISGGGSHCYVIPSDDL